MAAVLKLDDLRGGYVDVVRYVRDVGQSVAPRGEPTREVRDLVLEIADPLNTLPLGVGRKINPAIGAVEALQLIAGRAVPELMLKLSHTFGAFAEDDGTFWGAYGDRIGGQLLDVERKLKADPDTRQAVITLWDPKRDNDPGHRDYPCTIALAFSIRHDELLLSTLMRSNDVWLGLAYDAFQFTQLQVTLARALNYDVGPYTHHAVSMHLYERDLELVENLHAPSDEPIAAIHGVSVGAGSSATVRDAMVRARGLLASRWLPHSTTSEHWYFDQLRSIGV